MREARQCYTTVSQHRSSKDAESDKRVVRVINWHSGDRFVRVLCLNDRGEWIILEALDVPRDKGG